MKKLLCLFLAMLMIVSLVACDDFGFSKGSETTDYETETSKKKPKPSKDDWEDDFDDDDWEDDFDDDDFKTTEEETDIPTEQSTEPSTDEETEPETTEPETTEKLPDDDDPEGIFQTGYARVAITPDVPIGNFTVVANDIYATCVAVYDGETTVLLISVDVEYLLEGHCDEIREYIAVMCGVPGDNVFISATHNHSAPTFGWQWFDTACEQIARASAMAVNDLSDSDIFIGRGKTTGMAFVRRYVDANGNYATVSPMKADGAALDTATIRSVSEADDTMQLIRFKREGKKDIIALNWQAHFAHAYDKAPAAISSDMAHYIREDIEAGDDDALVAYFSGASGNINLNAPNNAQRKYRNYKAVAEAFAKVALEVMKDENLTEVNSGKINITKTVYAARHKKDSPEEIEAAYERLASGTGDVLRDTGDSYIISRNHSDFSQLRISALSFGDLAFVTAPYEMFDTNGVQIKEGSPFEMTFVLTISDGSFAYMPSYEAWTEYGGYETWATYFDIGVAEAIVNEFITMLDSHKKMS